MSALVLAQAEFTPPGADSFFLPGILPWGSGSEWALTKPMVLLVLSVLIISIFFLMASRSMKLVPGKFQFIAESIYDFPRNNIAREQIGSKEFMPFVPLILALFSFILVNNLFGIVPILQFPTMSHIGFPLALSVLVVYPVFNYVGIRKHGFAGYFKHQLMPPGAPWPVYILLVPIELVLKFIFNPITLAIRVFAAMFAGHLLLLMFTLGGAYLVTEAPGLIEVPAGIISWLFAIALTFLEALIMVIQAFIFALLSASYIGQAMAEEH